MLNTLLNLTRPLIVLDCETTGTDTQKDRIVEFAFQAWNTNGLEKEFRTLINPGIPMPKGAEGVHGITDAVLNSCSTCGQPDADHTMTLLDGSLGVTSHAFKPWPKFKQIAKAIATGFVNCDFAGKHVRFDLSIIAAEMAREGVEWNYVNAAIVDADRLEQLGDPRSLTHLVKKHLDEDMGSEAHTALGDVQWTTKLIVGQLKAYPCLPRDLDALHRAQWPGWIDGSGKFKFVDGKPCFAQWGKYAGKAMRGVPLDYYDWILKQDFPADVKALARNAKLGKFPEER